MDCLSSLLNLHEVEYEVHVTECSRAAYAAPRCEIDLLSCLRGPKADVLHVALTFSIDFAHTKKTAKLMFDTINVNINAIWYG